MLVSLAVLGLVQFQLGRLTGRSWTAPCLVLWVLPRWQGACLSGAALPVFCAACILYCLCFRPREMSGEL